MNGTLLDLVKELNTLSDDNLAARVIANSDVQWCLEELQDILEADREQVAGCKYCHEEWGTCNPITNRFTMPPGEIQFCPMCGKPLTAEAVDLVMQRLEALQDADD